MSYSRRELYALGETFGDSATELKVDGSRTYGGGGGKGKKPKRVQLTPANVSTGFGTALANPQTGQYSFTLDPRLAQMRDIFYGGAGQFQPTMQDQQFARDVSQSGINQFSQGQNFLNQALAQDPNQTAQQYYSDIQNLMSMDRAQEESRLANTLFKSGRTGAATGVQGGYLNPEQFALLKAREQANTQLGIQSQQLGRQQQVGDAAFGQGLMQGGLGNYGSGFAAGATPYNTMAGIFGLGTNIEGLGANTLNTALSAAQLQMQQQQQQQLVENARASSGKGGGLLGGALNAGLGMAMSGGNPLGGVAGLFGSSSPFASSTLGGSLQGIGNIMQYGYGGVSPFAGVGGIENNPYLNWRG
jgi:hypothetical protein